MTDTTSLLDELLPILDRFRSPNDISLATGGRLVCPLPWISKNAWLHKIMEPGLENYIDQLEGWVGRKPPAEFVSFLRSSNGLSLYYGSLHVYGLPTEPPTSPEQSLLTPFRIDMYSMVEWLDVLGKKDFLVGSMGPNVDGCIWRAGTGQIDRVSQESQNVEESWSSFRDWLMLEAERFAPLYKQNGELIHSIPIVQGKAEPWPQESLLLQAADLDGALPPGNINTSTPLALFVGTWNRRDTPPRSVTEGELAKAEEKLGLKLPVEYISDVQFIGLPIASTTLEETLINSEADALLYAPQEFLTPDEIVQETLAWRDMGLPSNLIAFASDGLGNLICFESREEANRPQISKVVFFDHDIGETELIHESFGQWINQLNSIEPVAS